LIILLAGAPCIGKSMIATHLAEKLNISNVLSTNMVDLVLKNLKDKNNKPIFEK
jgi:2-phosphoglycerate kinase